MKKSIIIEKLLNQKGGPGSGSWNGPASPRFSRDRRARRINEGDGKAGSATLNTRRGEKLVECKRGKDGKLKLGNGKSLPDFLPKNIPPAWTNVFVNTNPKGVLWVSGLDKKGKPQPIYNPEFRSSRDAKKFKKIKKLEKDYDSAYKKVDNDASKSDAASCLRLIMATGARPTDSEGNKIKADKEAYGAVSLRAKHITVKGKDVVIIVFTLFAVRLQK